MNIPNYTLSDYTGIDSKSTTKGYPNYSLSGDYGYSYDTKLDYYQELLKEREEALQRQAEEAPAEAIGDTDNVYANSGMAQLGELNARLAHEGSDDSGEYVGANGQRTSWSTQAKNINIRDALSINLQSRLTEFMNAEGKWLPEMEIAREYLVKKQELLEELASGKDNIETDIKAFNELETQVKELARTNPYLRDIFYGEATMPAFSRPGQIYPEKVAKSTVNRALEQNRWQDRDLINNSWAQANNELNDLTTANSRLLNKLVQLDQNVNELKDIYGDKEAEIKEKQEALKTPHNLHLLGINTGISYNPDMIDPKFDEERNNADISLLDPSTYKYGLTHIGSSLSEAQMMGATYAIAAAVKYGSKAVKNPYAWAAGEVAANLMMTKYFRNKETAAEVLSAYGEKLLQNADNFDMDQVFNDYQQQLTNRGFDTTKMDALEMLQMGLAFDIPTQDKAYNEFAKNARVGLTQLEQENNALSLMDYAENVGLSYGGALLKTGVKDEVKALAKKTAGNLIARNAKVQKGFEALKHRTGRLADKVLSKPTYKVAAKRAVDAIGDFVKTTAKRSILEGIEEGQQGVFQRRYLDTPVTDNAQEQPYSFFQGVVQDATGGVEAILAYYGLHPNDMYNTDEQITHAMDIGGFVGGLMAGVGNVRQLNRTRKQIKSDLSLTSLMADGGAKAENSFKVAQFLDSYRHGNNSTYLRNSLEALKKYKGEGVTDQMINEDIVMAGNVYDIYQNKAIKPNLEELGIDRDEGEDFTMFVQNQIDIINRLKDNGATVDEANKDVESKVTQLFNKEADNPFNTFVKQQYELYKKTTANPVDYDTFRKPVVNILVARAGAKALNQLYKDVTERKKTLEQIKKEYGIDVDVRTLSGLEEYIKELRKEHKKQLDKANKEMLSGKMDLVEDPANMEELQGLLSKQALLQGLQDVLSTKLGAYSTGRLPVKARWMVERKPLFNNLTPEEQEGIIKQYSEKWKEAHKTDQEPTRKQVIAYYNQKVQTDWAKLEESANVEGNERTLANAMFREDLAYTKQFKRKGQEENREQLGVEPDVPATEPTEPAHEEKPEPVNPPAEPEKPAAGNDNKPTAKEEAVTNKPQPAQPTQDDITDNTEGEPTTEVAANDIVDDFLDRVSDQEFTDDGVIEVDRTKPDPAETPDEVSGNTEQVDVDNTPLNPVVGTNQNDDIDNTPQQQSQGINQDTDIADISDKVDAANQGNDIASVETEDQTDAVQESEPEPDDNIKAQPKVQVPKSKGKTATVHVESFDGSNDMEVEVPLDDETPIIHADDSGVSLGEEDAASIDVPAEAVSMQEDFDQLDAVDLGTSVAANAAHIDKSPGLDSKKKIGTKRISNTLFYQPTAEEVMDISVNGEPVQFDGERRPGKELAQKLLIPGWLSKQKVYFIVTDGKDTRKTEGGAADRLAVHMIIEETTEDGKVLVYNTALYTPDKADAKMREWGVADPQVRAKAKHDLRQIRKDIISKFIEKYAPNYFTDPKVSLPKVAQKGIVPVGLRLSNGSISNQKDAANRPIYKPLTEVAAFGLSEDPIEMSRQISSGEVEFGMGKGPFPLIPDDRFAIVHFDNVTYASQQGVGYAGKLYIIPPVAATPSQRISAPIMLAEKRHFIPGGSKNLITSFTPDFKPKFDDNGKRIPLSSAELLFRLITQTFGIYNNVHDDLLDILANHGSSTMNIEGDQSKLSFYVRKTLHYFENEKGGFLAYGYRESVPGTSKAFYRVKYLKIRDINGNIVFTDQQAYEVIRQISNNIHWNTDKEMMMQPISQNIVDAAIAYMEKYNVDYYRVANCEDLTFTMRDLNLKRDANGKVIKAGDTPLLMTWMINHQIIKTDVGDNPFSAPFIYADGAAVTDVPVQESQNAPETHSKPRTDTFTPQGEQGIGDKKGTLKTPENASNMTAEEFLASDPVGVIENVTRPDNDSRELSLLQQKYLRAAIRKVFEDPNSTRQKLHDAVSSNAQHTAAPMPVLAYLYEMLDRVHKNEITVDQAMDKIEHLMLKPIGQSNKTSENASQSTQIVTPADKTKGFKVLSDDEAKAAGYTPKIGYKHVIKPDGSHVVLADTQIDQLKKRGVFSTEKGKGKIDIDKAKAWLHKTLGIDPDDVMVTNAIMKAVNAPQAYGLLQAVFDRLHDEFVPRITLSTKAGRGVEYHEAWHYVSLLLLNDNVRNQIYSDFVTRNPEYKNATKQEVEEALAEEFRNYMLNETGFNLGYRIKKFFRSVWNLIKSMAGKRLNLQDEVFNNIRKGKFKDAQLSQDVLAEFNKAHDIGIGYYAPGVSEEEQKKIPHITNANTLYNIVESLSSTALAILDIKSMDDIKNLSLDDVFNNIQTMYDFGAYDDNEVKKQLVNDVLTNKDLFGKQIRMYLQDLGVKAIEREETKIAEEEARESGADNIWDRASYEISKKANVAFNAKLFFYSIPKAKFALNENGEQVVTTVKDNIFGLDITQPFDVTWNRILDSLWESNDWEDLLSKVRNLAKAEPFFQVLLDRIDNPAYPLPENTITQLLTTIQSAKNSMDTIEIKNLSGRKVAQGRGNYNWDVADSSNLRKIRRLPSQWSQNFLLSAMVTTDAEGRSKIDSKAYQKLNSLDRDILKDIKEIESKLSNKKPEVRQEGINQFEATKQKFLDLMNMIGVPLDYTTLEFALKHQYTKVTNNPEFFVFKAMYTAMDGSISNSIVKNIRVMNTNRSLDVKRKANQSISASRVFNYKSPNAVMNILAVAYGTVHPTPEEFSVTGADGSLVYPITQNNYMSDQLRWLNTNAKGKLDNLSRSPYSQHSLIVQALTSKDKPKLKLHTLLAINEDSSGSSRKYFEITPLEDYITKLTLIHKGRLILPTMSDKPTWYSIEGITLPKDFLHSMGFDEDPVSGESIFVEADRKFSNQTLDIFCNYFLDEYNAIVNYFNTKADVEKGKSRYYDNYHGKIGKDGKMQPGGQGGRFRYFNQMPINGKWVSLNQMLDAAERSGDESLVKQALDEIRERFIHNQALLRDSMNTLLLDKVDKEIEKAIELGVISRDSNGNLLYGNLPSTKEFVEEGAANIFAEYERQYKGYPKEASDAAQNDIIYSMIANFVTGYAISIEEVEKCFTGDPAFYKWKSDSEVGIFQRDVDKIKRLSSVLSTGTNLRTSWGQNDSRNSTKFTSAVMSDNTIGSEYHAKLLSIFKADAARTMLKKNNPSLTDDELFELTSDDNLEATLANRDLVSEADVKLINKSAEKAADPYAYDDEHNSGNINQSDAAVYIRPEFYKRIMQSLGEWSPEIERAYNILENADNVLSDPDVYAKALRASIKPLKMVYFGDHFDNTIKANVPIYDKMALFPMFKVLAKADNKALYDRMNNKELGIIDMLAFESAVKVGSTRDKLQVYKDNRNTQLNTDAINAPSSMKVNYAQDSVMETKADRPVLTTRVQDIAQLRLQLNTNPEAETERSFGTQAVKICIGNVIDDRSYGSNKGKSITGLQIKKDVFGCIKALSSKGHQKMLDRFFNNDGSIKPKALSEYLQREARGTNMSAEVIESLQLDDKGNFKVPIAAMSIRNWIESKVISLINKEVVDVNTPGGSAIQMAPFGFRRNQILTDENDDTRPFNDGNKLSFDPDKGSMEVMLSTNYFRDIVPKVFQKDYVTMRNWLLDHNIIGPNAKPYGVGYRIPTQGLSSTISFVVADVLPEFMGDVIVVPDEFTAMTGSDYDIDHLYLATYAYDEEGNRYEFDESKDYNEQENGALINKLLDSYTLVISDSKTMAQTRASIDTLTSILKKEILPLVQVTEMVEADPMYELMPSFQEDRKTEYSSGKAGIAPFALNSTNHCLTQAVHLRMRYSPAAVKYQLGELDAVDSQDDNRYRILDWLSAMINAHVDVAKDPYILTLNVNQVTYNMTNFLLRTGKGKTTFLFMAQPILKEFTREMIANRGIIGVNKRTETQILRALHDKYLAMLNRYSNTFSKAYKERVKNLLSGDIRAFDDKKLAASLEAFRTKDISPEDIIQQLLVLRAYSDLSKDAQTLSDLVQRSQIDTKKYGNNLSQLQNFYNSYTTFREDNIKKFYTNTMEDNGLDVYFNETFLHQKLMSVLSLSTNLLNNQVLPATDGYKELLTYILATVRGGFGEYDPVNTGHSLLYRYRPTSDKKYVSDISSKLESIVRAKAVAAKTGLIMTDKEINDALFGKASVAHQLNAIKNYIRVNKDDPNLMSLVDEYGNSTNEFLNYLQAVTSNNKRNVSYLSTATSSMNNSRYYEDRLKSGFYDLLYSTDPLVKKFAEKLVKYAFLTSYDNRTPSSFFNLVPMQYRRDSGYVDAIKDTMAKFNAGDATQMDHLSVYLTLVRNYYKDDALVPVVVRKSFENGGSNVINIATSTDNKHRAVNTVISVVGNYEISQNNKFIKIISPANNSIELYERVGYISDVESGKTKEIVYAIVPKLGYDAGSKSVYELYTDGYEQSAFEQNQFTSDMINQVNSVYDLVDARLKRRKNNDRVFEKDPDYVSVDLTTPQNVDEEVSDFVNVSLNDSTLSVSMDEADALDITNTDTDEVLSIEDLTAGPEVIESFDTGDTIIEDMSGDTISIEDTDGGPMNISEDLARLGKQRKEECK